MLVSAEGKIGEEGSPPDPGMLSNATSKLSGRRNLRRQGVLSNTTIEASAMEVE